MTEYGIKAMRQIQMNRESAFGTPGATWFNWRGPGLLEDQRVGVFPEENIGLFPGSDRQYFSQLRGELNIPDHPATFEQLGHVLDAGIARATPAADTGGGATGFIRNYLMPIKKADLVKASGLQTYSIKNGDNVAVDKAGGAFVKSFSLTGARGEAWMLGVVWETTGVTDDSGGFAPTPVVPVVEEMLFGLTKVYIDNDDDNYGDTQVAGALINATLNVETGWVPLYTADGSLSYSTYKQRAPEIILNLTMEMTAGGAKAEREKFRAGIPRLIMLACEGSALTKAGVYASKTLELKMAGKWDRFDPLGEDDGDDIITGSFRCRYNAASDSFWEAILVNEVATL